MSEYSEIAAKYALELYLIYSFVFVFFDTRCIRNIFDKIQIS